MSIPSSIAPKRILFTMLNVKDIGRSVAFYRDMLGMNEIERETFPDGKFAVVYMGYGDKDRDTVIELTHDWENADYEHGTAYGNISLAVDDLYALERYLKDHGVKFLRPAGELPFAPMETGKKYVLARIVDPDGFQVELIQTN